MIRSSLSNMFSLVFHLLPTLSSHCNLGTIMCRIISGFWNSYALCDTSRADSDNRTHLRYTEDARAKT